MLRLQTSKSLCIRYIESVAFENEQGETIYRQDAQSDEIKNIKNDPDGYGKVWREFPTHQKPVKWVVWPYSTSQGWCDKIEGNL
jgi:hypothetical protein